MPKPSGRSLITVLALITAACGATPPDSPTPLRSSAPPSPSSSAPTILSTPAATAVPVLSASALSDLVAPDRLHAHLEALQAIADESGGNRATGTIGFERSVDYVTGVLRDAGYAVDRQPFSVGDVTSWNLLVDRGGTGDGVLLIGAHLDSVAAGAGINDNASGVAALLVLAEALQHLPAPSRGIRFAFWGAEEGGPFGSAAYVDSLVGDSLAAIDAYLNLDMAGSPNGVTFVYEEPDAAAGSSAITNTITTYFERRGLPWEPIDLQGHADHGPFTAAGVPTGGLFSGGIEPVTADQAARHGAVAGRPADPCSHAVCDRIDNVDLARLALMTDALAAILVALAAEPAG